MSPQILTYLIMFLVFIVSGHFFLPGIAQIFQKNRENAALMRQVEALARVEEDIDYSSLSHRVGNETKKVPSSGKAQTEYEFFLEVYKSNKSLTEVYLAEIDRLNLIQAARLEENQQERELLVEMTLDPRSEESIRRFLRKAHKANDQRERETEESRGRATQLG